MIEGEIGFINLKLLMNQKSVGQQRLKDFEYYVNTWNKRKQIPGKDSESDLIDFDELDRNSSGTDDYDKLPNKLQNQVKKM